SSSSSLSSPRPRIASPSSDIPSRVAAASTARKKKRSKTSSKTRLSSWLLASVAARPSRKSSGSVQPISPSTANASSSSEVPIARPSRRSSSPSSRMRAGSPQRSPGATSGDIGGRGELQPDALGDDVHVGSVLDDHGHRLGEDFGVDVVRAEQEQRACPVDRLGDRGRLLEVELAHHADDFDELAGDR